MASRPLARAVAVIFFFQAEAGIRYVAVTGVQTCALPIYGLRALSAPTLSATRAGGEPRLREVLASPKMLAILFLGAASGFPNQITESALQAWLKRSEEHTSELQSRLHLVCRLLLEKKKIK